MENKEYIDNQIKWLKDYTDTRFDGTNKAVDKVESTNKDAVDKVEKTNTQKFEAQNEWRQQFKDQTSMFVTRRELWAAVFALIGAVGTIAGVTFALIKK